MLKQEGMMEAMTVALIYFSFFAVPLMLVTAVEYIICKFFPHLELWIERKIIGEPHGNAKK